MDSPSGLVDDLDSLIVLDSLIQEVTNAEKELENVREQLRNQPKVSDDPESPGYLLAQANLMKAETKELATHPPEDLVEDAGVRYYLAVGLLEKEIMNLQTLKSCADAQIGVNVANIKELRDLIEDQNANVAKLESIVEEKRQEEESADGKNKVKRELECQLRRSRQLTSEFKSFLKEFIDKTATLEPNIEKGKAPMGFLFQALWSSFQYHGASGWVNIKEQGFTVRPQDVELLKSNEIIRVNSKNEDEIQLEDFTMRN